MARGGSNNTYAIKKLKDFIFSFSDCDSPIGSSERQS